MNICYDWYKIFCCVAECKSITIAADRMYISQPAVSQTIKQLEETLGCPLFLRTPKGVRLTAEGEMLYNDVSEGIEAFSRGESRLAAMLRLDAGEIRIGASDMTLEFCLLPYLVMFHRQYPNVKISITNNPTPQTLELLKQGKIDFAAVSELFSCPGFEVFSIREIRDIFICHSERKLSAVEDLANIKDELIMLEGNTSTRMFLDKEFKKRSVYVLPKFTLATSSLIVEFTAKNMGIGCVVSDFASQAIADGRVKEVKISDPLPERHICIIRNNDIRSIAANKLFDLIINNSVG